MWYDHEADIYAQTIATLSENQQYNGQTDQKLWGLDFSQLQMTAIIYSCPCNAVCLFAKSARHLPHNGSTKRVIIDVPLMIKVK
jgi:hypothetical protein